MKIAILTAILGNFDKPVDPVKQDTEHEVVFHRFTDEDFPPITGLTPRLQYRIPKLFGWEMFPGHDIYVWLDGACSFKRPDCLEWYLDQLGDNEIALFRHPVRGTAKKETDHIEEKLQAKHPYMMPRYANGLHKEMYEVCLADPDFVDKDLYASTMFVYRNTPRVQAMMKDWWYYQSRYYTCDQVSLMYVLQKHRIKVKKIDEPMYKIGYLSLVSKH